MAAATVYMINTPTSPQNFSMNGRTKTTSDDQAKKVATAIDIAVMCCKNKHEKYYFYKSKYENERATGIRMGLLVIREGLECIEGDERDYSYYGDTTVLPADLTNCGNISLNTTHNSVARLASFAATDT